MTPNRDWGYQGTWAMGDICKCWSGGSGRRTHRSHPHSVLCQNCIGSLTDTSGIVKSIYQAGYANFQGFSSLCLQGLKLGHSSMAFYSSVYLCSSSCLYSRCRVCAVRVPCKRCSCCRVQECPLTVLAFSMKDAAKPNPEPSFITQTAVQWSQYFLFWASPPLLRLENKFT